MTIETRHTGIVKKTCCACGSSSCKGGPSMHVTNCIGASASVDIRYESCMKAFARVLLLLMMALGAERTLAQNYPNRPIRLVVASSPGGTSDILARMLAHKVSQEFGEQMVVDNRGGGSGVIGTDIVAKAPPDGYTLLIIQPTLTINPSMIKKLPYDAARDLAPVTMVVDAAQVMSVTPSLPAKSVKELIALAKAKPDSIMFASPGVGTGPHLAAELFKLKAGVKMPQVLFKGSGAAYISVISGEVPAAISAALAAMPHIRSGKIRALGVTTAKRITILPDVPTIAESLPGFETSQWFGILAPAHTPRPLIDRLYGVFTRAANSPEVKDRLAAEGVEVVNRKPEEFAAVIKQELVQWAQVIKAAGIEPQ
jgi:tripartite-type tricarboxylate transporter receptor subunit TctC